MCRSYTEMIQVMIYHGGSNLSIFSFQNTYTSFKYVYLSIMTQKL